MKIPTVSATKRVLVIDDEATVVKPIEHILRLFHYEAITATQWTDALELLQSERFDLITLDLEMPTIDGPTMLKFLRENGNNTPVIVISASITDHTPVELAEFDVAAFVYKPFKVSHIKEIIEQVIGESVPSENQTTPDATSIDEAVQISGKRVQAEEDDPEADIPVRRRVKRRKKMFSSKDQRNQTLIAMAIIALISLFLSGFMEVFKKLVEGMF